MTGPTVRLSAAAVEHLDGRPLVVRASHRNGCCGGAAEVPVAEPGLPQDPSGYERVDVDGVEAFVDRALDRRADWLVDVDRLWRWSRLCVEPARAGTTDRS
ncbi:MAG: hypothetical protein JJU45_04770 [Acidimicrobiia bacterium]|nr:hypothetical protein [Acidimicrobiia bacterium]